MRVSRSLSLLATSLLLHLSLSWFESSSTLTSVSSLSGCDLHQQRSLNPPSFLSHSLGKIAPLRYRSSLAPLLRTLQTLEVSLHTQSRTIAAKSCPRHTRRSARYVWEGSSRPFVCPSFVLRAFLPRLRAGLLGTCTRNFRTCVCRPHSPYGSIHKSTPFSGVDFRDVLVIVCTQRGPEPLLRYQCDGVSDGLSSELVERWACTHNENNKMSAISAWAYKKQTHNSIQDA